MQARAKLLGHPVHQMLIVLPLGLLSGGVIFDLIHLATGDTEPAIVAYWAIGAGVLAGLLAAVFGLIDWSAIPRGTRAKRIGAVHGVGNVIVVTLFGLSWWLRRAGIPEDPSGAAIALALAGGALSLVTGWLGGELVDRMGIGVDDGANVDAPSSLSGRPAGPDMSPTGALGD